MAVDSATVTIAELDGALPRTLHDAARQVNYLSEHSDIRRDRRGLLLNRVQNGQPKPWRTPVEFVIMSA